MKDTTTARKMASATNARIIAAAREGCMPVLPSLIRPNARVTGYRANASPMERMTDSRTDVSSYIRNDRPARIRIFSEVCCWI